MTRGTQIVILLAVGLIAAAAGWFFHPANRGPDLPATAHGALMQATMPDLAGQAQPMSQWKGKVILVNFWATWCAPCRKEIPLLVAKQNELGATGLQVIGIAVDQLDKAKAFAAEMGINYPILVDELQALDLSRAVGNEMGALPYTLVVDRDGRIVRTELGTLSADKLDALIRPYL